METVGRTHAISSTVPLGAEHTTRSRPRHEVPIAERHQRLAAVEALARESFSGLPLEFLTPTQLIAELSTIQKAVRTLDQREAEIGWDAFVACRGDLEMRILTLQSEAVHAEISRRIQALAPPPDLTAVSDEELCWLEYGLIKANNGWLIESNFLKFAEFGLFEQYLARVRREVRHRQADGGFNHRTPWLARWRFDEPGGAVFVVADYVGTKPSDFPAGSPTARERAANERRAHEVFAAAHGHPSTSKPTFAGTLLKPGFERFASSARPVSDLREQYARLASSSDPDELAEADAIEREIEDIDGGPECIDTEEVPAQKPGAFRSLMSALLRLLGVAR